MSAAFLVVDDRKLAGVCQEICNFYPFFLNILLTLQDAGVLYN